MRKTWKWADLNIIDIVSSIVVVGHIYVVDVVIVIVVVVIIVVVVAVGVVDEVGGYRGCGEDKVDECETGNGTCRSTVRLSIITLWYEELCSRYFVNLENLFLSLLPIAR